MTAYNLALTVDVSKVSALWRKPLVTLTGDFEMPDPLNWGDYSRPTMQTLYESLQVPSNYSANLNVTEEDLGYDKPVLKITSPSEPGIVFSKLSIMYPPNSSTRGHLLTLRLRPIVQDVLASHKAEETLDFACTVKITNNLDKKPMDYMRVASVVSEALPEIPASYAQMRSLFNNPLFPFEPSLPGSPFSEGTQDSFINGW